MPEIRKKALLARVNKPFSRAEYDRKVEQIATEAGSRFGRGNILTKNGLFLTPDKVEQEREELRQKLRRETSPA